MAKRQIETKPIDETIPKGVRNVLMDNLGLDEWEVTRDSRLVEDLGANDLDIVEIAMALEEQYGIEIPDRVYDEWPTATVNSIVETAEKAGAKF
jgi:acyl carrier protein